MITKFTVKGMHCNSCKLLIEDLLIDIKGVTSSSVDFKTGNGVVEHDEKINPKLFKDEIEKMGKYVVQIVKK